MSSSLRRQLLAWVLAPLVIAVAVDTWLTQRSAFETASEVQDRLLLGSARMIAEQISFEDGAFQHQIPPAAFELFQSENADRIFYRITTGGGQLLSGYTDLPIPVSSISTDSPYFFDASMRNKVVRIVAFHQPVIGNPSALPVVVEVAQTTHDREQLTHALWLRALRQQLLILALTAFFVLLGLQRGLQPLLRLCNDVRARKEGSLIPLRTNQIPAELMPLVDTFNTYIQRLENYTHNRNMFIQNAAHQLRTPLTVMGTQISDALRADSKRDTDVSLGAARNTLQKTVRLVNQFLALSSAEGYVATMAEVSTQQCCDLVQQVLEDLALQAHGKNIDLGFEHNGQDTLIQTDLAAIREIAINLIDNSIRYTPSSGTVTVRIESTPARITLVVEDDGPGVAIENREKIFQRFYRINDTTTEGSGLGLAIVKELALQCNAKIRLSSPAHGDHGLLISIEFSGT
jgi:two-component system sensor histidine kinase TctE